MGGWGGEGVDIRRHYRWDYRVDLPFVEGNCRVGLVGAVEGGIGPDWRPYV